MMKRIIALLLALILTVGLLPTVALAAGETENNDVVPGKYVNGVWTKGDLTQTLPAGVKSINKTATKTGDNTYDVTLEVVLKQTEENSGKAATVLVLDTSGSMAYCAECGTEGDCVHNYVKFNGTPNSKGQYYYKTTDKNGKEEFERAYYCDRKHILPNKKHTAGWFTTSGDSIWHDPQTDSLAGQTIYVKSPTPRASRLDAAKVAAENFLKTYSGLTFKADGTPADNQNNRNLGRYVSVVSFATKAESVQSWVDVSNSDVYKEVLKNIKRLNANGGTNLDAGLTYAEYLLKQTTVNDAVKNVIALTDGQPTFFIDTNERAYNDDGLTGLDREFLTIDNTTYRVHGTGDSCNAKTFTETVASADAVKNHAKLYTVCFDAEEKIDVPNNGGQISVSEYLSTKIATQPTKTGEQFAYDADNAEKLYAEFAKITQSIVSGLNNGTVRDTLPTGITSAAFGEDNVKEWKLNEKPFTKNETTNTVDGKQVTTYTYTYTYTVTINPLTVAKTEIDGAYYAPLNGDTTLTVKSGDTDVEIPFPIPAGKVTMPSYKVTYKIDDAQYGDVDTVDFGTEVTVRENPTKAGYSFSGWSTTDATVADGKFTMPDKDVTITGSWMLKDPTAVNVDLNDHIYKTFTSDTADIPNGKLTFNVTVSGISNNAASMTRRGSVEFTKQDVTTSKAFTFAGDQLSFTAAGEYTFKVVEDTTTTINGLTYNVGNGTHTFTIVVDKKANTNELEVKEVRVGTEEYTGVDLTDTLAYATITNNYIEPKKTFDLNNTIFKTFTPVAGGLPIPTGEGISYTFTARMTEQTEEGFAVGDTGRNYTLKATLTGEVIEANKVPFTVEGASEVSFAPGTYYFLVQEDSTAAVTGTVNGTIHNDSQAYLLTLTVKEDQGKLDFETDVKPATVVMSLEEPTPGLGTITFNNTYEEKEPGKYTIDFSDLIVKCLTKEGSKAFTGAEFTANVTGWKYMKEEAKPWAMLANATSFAFTDLPSRTLTATFLADAVFNPDNEAYRPFTGDTLTVEEGDYLFLIEENNGGQSNITYDEAKYWLAVRVRFEDDEPIVAVYRRTYTAGDSYNTVFENETKWSDPIPANITPVTFYNTIDTGKDDYYPIIIPTIINKDTGMLNKTDHFAYVIGYPDGTVHPNGQITRAEVATIFFRLLRDEVRDGAFTTSNSYSDVAYGKWYNNPISTMSALGIITGYPDGTFKPNKPITRAEFAAIAARFDETQSGKSATFSDVIGHWAAKEIGIAYYNDWIKGYPDGTFKPDQNITRAEAMTLINRVLERKPESPADLLTNMNKWTDNMDTSKWYYLDVQEATNSHGYTRKTFNYELWRQMLPDPDWSRYER